MGTYLSTPVTDKCEESGEALTCPEVPLRWGIVDMQGWRKSMEDAHVAQTDVEGPHFYHPPEDPVSGTKRVVDSKVFGIFDGHGGPEVARFCQRYIVSVLTQQPTWTAAITPQQQQPDHQPQTTIAMKTSPVGQALTSTFHALDRMIDDPNRREELVRLRAIKPDSRERLHAANIPPEKKKLPVVCASTPCTSSSPTIMSDQSQEAQLLTDNGDDLASTAVNSSSDSKTTDPETTNGGETTPGTGEEQADCISQNIVVVEAKVDDCNGEDCSDDDSNEAVGKEEAAENDRDLMMDDSPTSDSEADVLETSGTTAGKVSVMFQRLLNMGSPTAGQIVVQLKNPSKNAAEEALATEPDPVTAVATASSPATLRNGRMICNLPDHAIHAGATAVVAVIVGRTITVANAGDSRAILCRNGTAYPLSFDHKPSQVREMTRIRNAGGFVNHFGRVNGNLNLSRSIGDLKYKQVPNIPPEEQIITAEPDILSVELGEQDEFLILGCDGIWDCLTNEKAVDYVRSRIDTMLPTEIGIQMLNDIISTDPRATQGIGGDNMTIMVVDLKPLSRSYRIPDSSPT